MLLSRLAMKIGTHSGAFHADEVLATTMLRILPKYKDAEIVRTRDPAQLAECDIVVDVGAVFDPASHRYDHHQKSFSESVSTLMPGKKWTTKLSSAGLVYVHFGKDILKEILKSDDEVFVDKIFDKVYSNFMEEIDAHDNGISSREGEPRFQITTDIGSRVAALRPAWNDAQQDFDKGFHKAMEMVRPEFVDRVTYYGNVWWPARALVQRALETRFDVHPSGRVVAFLEGACPYKEHLFELEEEQNIAGFILYAVFPDHGMQWRVAAVGVQGQQFESRLNLPVAWRALRDAELDTATGLDVPDGAVFVHSAGFIGGHKSKEGAVRMAAKALEVEGLECA